MADDVDPDVQEDDYDEDADSDFNEQASDAASVSSSAYDEPTKNEVKSGKKATSSKPLIEELDSGDEVTIKERQKLKKRQKRRKHGHVSSDDERDEKWQAKTRSMRAQEQAERQKKTLASLEASTIDVEKMWEEMNKPGPLPPIRMEGEDIVSTSQEQAEASSKDNKSGLVAEETITIKRQFKFAGEIHVEEKTVAKSSAEARLWLAQQDNKKPSSDEPESGRVRPLRKISRFDPNYSNLEAFRNHSIQAQSTAFKGPKLNVVEKSKMDWATHVDTEGLKEELDEHSKAKDAYLNRMDFLNQVEQRKENEARQARQKG